MEDKKTVNAWLLRIVKRTALDGITYYCIKGIYNDGSYSKKYYFGKFKKLKDARAYLRDLDPDNTLHSEWR